MRTYNRVARCRLLSVPEPITRIYLSHDLLTIRSNKEMVETKEPYRIRKLHWEGKGGIACCLNIPIEFAQMMGFDKQSYIKVTNEGNKLLVEKVDL